jgi:N-acetylglucosamine kinase-like BadF-type ATPase
VPQQSSPRVVIGLDGGGTKTIACVVDTKTRTQLSSCKTLSSNKYSVGEAKAKNEIFNAMNGALKEANLNLSNVDGISLGMSGVDRPEDKELVRRWMEEFVGEYKHIKIKVNSDTFTSISSGTLGVLHGMVIIAGTGSIVVATDGGESQVRAGGWGPLLGDVGSGWAIGHDVLCAVARAVV